MAQILRQVCGYPVDPSLIVRGPHKKLWGGWVDDRSEHRAKGEPRVLLRVGCTEP
jgi:hypothetical protein